MVYYARSSSIHRGLLGHCLKAANSSRHSAYPSRIVCNNFTSSLRDTPLNRSPLYTTSHVGVSPSQQQHQFLSTSSTRRHQTTSSSINKHRHTILTNALQHVHTTGWTDESIANGTLDAGLPPSYIGQATTSTSSFGSGDLVAFFMNECNANLKQQLVQDVAEEKRGDNSLQRDNTNNDMEQIATRINKAIHIRLSMILPYIKNNKWVEGMAIGALPQNAVKTAEQLDELAIIVLDYALKGSAENNRVGSSSKHNAAKRAAVVAVYAATELHLLADGQNNTTTTSSVSLSGEQYQGTWKFLEERSNEVANLIVNGVKVGKVTLPNTTQVMAASAVVSSLAGAALSLAAPTVAGVAGTVLPRAMESILTPIQSVVASSSQLMNNTSQGGDGTKPSDYTTVATETLPPFDTSEEIFPSKA